MFKNYFKFAWRNLTKDRQFSILNLLGLSTGLACALLIFLWVNDEKAVDKFHEKDNRLFRVMQNNVEPGGIQTSEGAPGPLAKALVEEMPDVEDAVTVRLSVPGGATDGILSFGKSYSKARENYVTPNFFNLFSYELIVGNKDQVLKYKYAVVLSDELALKLFNSTENLIGKSVQWDRGDLSRPYIISGIFKKPAVHSSAQFDLLLNYELLFEKYSSRLQDWGSSMTNTYVVLKKGTPVKKFNDKIRDFVKLKFTGGGGDSKTLQYIPTIFLQQYSDQYLYNRFENGVQAGGRIQYVRL